MIEIELPDKKLTLEFPDDTPEDVMRKSIQQKFYGATPDSTDPWYLKKISLPDAIDPDKWDQGVKDIETSAERIKHGLINPKAPLGAMETAAHIGTMTYGVPATGIGHIIDLVTDGKYRVAERVADKLIYEPQTESGEVIRDILFSPFSVAEKIGDDRATTLYDELAEKYGPDDIRTTLYPTIRKSLWDILGIVVSGKGMHLPRSGKGAPPAEITGEAPKLDATYAKDQVLTETALERTRGGKPPQELRAEKGAGLIDESLIKGERPPVRPLETLATKEAWLKGEIPIEGERAQHALRAEQFDRTFTEIPSQKDIIRRNFKEHEGSPAIIEAAPAGDPRIIDVKPDTTEPPIIEVPSVVQGRRVKLPEDIAREKAEQPPPDPVQERLDASAKMNSDAFYNRKPTTMFPKKKESKVATLRGKIKELGGIHSKTFRERVGKYAMKDVPNETDRLLRTDGVPYDLLEKNLQDEGWLYPGEDLVDLIQTPENLRRGRILVDPFENKLDVHMTAKEKKFLEELEWEPEEPEGFTDLPTNLQDDVLFGRMTVEDARAKIADMEPLDDLSAFFEKKKRTAWDTVNDINTLMSEKGELNLTDIKALSPEQQAAYLRLSKDFNVIKRYAARTGKTIEQYLTDIKVDPQVAAMLAKKAEDLPKYAKSINVEKQDIPKDLKQFETDVADFSEPKKVQSWDETGTLSANLRGDYKKMNRTLEKAKSGEALTAVELDAVRQVNVNAIDKLKKLATEATPEEFAREYVSYKQNIFEALSTASSEAGRALNIHKKSISRDRMAQAFAKLERNLNERELKEFKELNTDNPVEIQRFMDRLGDPKLKDYLLEYWYNQILSGPPTHLINTISNTGWLLFQLPHRALTATVDYPISKLTGKQRTRYVNEIVPMLAGYKTGFKRGRRAAWQMLKDNKITNFDTKWAQEMGSSMGAFERSPNKALRKAAPYITPSSRALRAMDVWANSIAYDAHARALARRSSNLKKLTGKARTEFEREYIENLSDADHEACMKQARYNTFMDDPDPFTQWIINVRKVPAVGTPSQFIVPFVNTISNLTKRGLEMTPGVGLVKEGISRKMGRGQAAPEVIAKQIEGSVLALYILYKLDSGDITGPLPENKNEREAFYRQGKQPWAIKIGDTYHQYRRIEPFNTVIASVAIAKNAIENAEDDETATQIFLKTASGIKDNLIDSSYFQGIQQLFDRYGSAKGAVQRFTASWVPYSSFWRSINRAYETAAQGETKVREGDDWLKAFSQVIPGLSGKMPAKLDVWGEEIALPGGVFRQWLPYKWSEETSDPVEKELESLGIYPGKPRQKITFQGKKVELDDDMYRDYCLEFGQNAKAKLEDAISRPGYKTRPDEQKLQILKKRVDIARRQAGARLKRKLREASQ